MKQLKSIFLFSIIFFMLQCIHSSPDCSNYSCVEPDLNYDFQFPIVFDLRTNQKAIYTYTDSLQTYTFDIIAVKTLLGLNKQVIDGKCDNPRNMCAYGLLFSLSKDSSGINIQNFGSIYREKCVACPNTFYFIWDDTTQFITDTHLNFNRVSNDTTLLLSSPNCASNQRCRFSYFARNLAASWNALRDDVLKNKYKSFYYVEMDRPFARYPIRKENKDRLVYDTLSKPFMYLSTTEGIICFGDSKKKTKYYLVNKILQ